ncbi:MAG: 5'-3' exonuclease [Planctomycetota bacterium]|jgi:5'-3' exonuclease
MAVYLIDASPYIFRAYFSVPESMTSPEGQPVNAVYGFTNFLLKLIDSEEPAHLGAAFDESLTTCFRNEIYPEYKAQRELPPPALEAQLKDCQEVAAALGAAVYTDARFEADDFIGTICHRVKGGKVVVSGDKDLAQLVSEEVTLYDFARKVRYGPAEVVERYGVRPDQITDLLGLAGDSVDNIPGVKGIGMKSAVRLLEVFEHMEEVYARLGEVAALPIRGAKSIQAKLEEGREMAFLSKQLATVATSAPAAGGLRRLKFRGADRSLVEPLFDRLGFGRIRDRIRKWR